MRVVTGVDQLCLERAFTVEVGDDAVLEGRGRAVWIEGRSSPIKWAFVIIASDQEEAPRPELGEGPHGGEHHIEEEPVDLPAIVVRLRRGLGEGDDPKRILNCRVNDRYPRSTSRKQPAFKRPSSECLVLARHRRRLTFRCYAAK